MSSGRTSWWAKDAAWYRRERVVALMDEFGPAGAVVIDWLSCEAASQDGYHDGTVKAGMRTISRHTGVDVAVVARIITRAEALELLEEVDLGPLVFTCRISGWRADRERALGAVRKARWAASNAEERSGTEKDTRNPHNTSQQGEAKASPTAEVAALFAYWQEQCKHSQAKLTTDRRTKVTARLNEGYTVEQIRAAIDGAARGAFKNDAGHVFDDLELICRTGSKVEQFIAKRTATARPVRGAPHLLDQEKLAAQKADWEARHADDDGKEA